MQTRHDENKQNNDFIGTSPLDPSLFTACGPTWSITVRHAPTQCDVLRLSHVILTSKRMKCVLGERCQALTALTRCTAKRPWLMIHGIELHFQWRKRNEIRTHRSVGPGVAFVSSAHVMHQIRSSRNRIMLELKLESCFELEWNRYEISAHKP